MNPHNDTNSCQDSDTVQGGERPDNAGQSVCNVSELFKKPQDIFIKIAGNCTTLDKIIESLLLQSLSNLLFRLNKYIKL